MLSLPSITSLQSREDTERTQVLDLLFEPSRAIHDTLLPVVRSAAEYSSYPELIDACHVRLRSKAATNGNVTNPDTALLSILGSHPRLGARKVESAQSAAEQANLQGEGEELAQLNQEYEAKFPGLRYVVFVNGRGRPDIMQDMKARIARGDYAMEVDAALQAMCDIAKDRASKLQKRGE